MSFDIKKAAVTAAQVAAGVAVVLGAAYLGGKLGQAFGLGKGEQK